jgi:hypothetical protein
MKSPYSLTVLPVLAVLALVLAACSADGGSSPGSSSPAPAPSGSVPAPTPTPIAAEVTGPADAAALVIATDPRFEGAIERTPDVIGASRWWEALPLADGAYRITLTIGWGDCPSGCIESHTWAFRVTADGQVTLLEEFGDPIPEGSFPAR